MQCQCINRVHAGREGRGRELRVPGHESAPVHIKRGSRGRRERGAAPRRGVRAAAGGGGARATVQRRQALWASHLRAPSGWGRGPVRARAQSLREELRATRRPQRGRCDDGHANRGAARGATGAQHGAPHNTTRCTNTRAPKLTYTYKTVNRARTQLCRCVHAPRTLYATDIYVVDCLFLKINRIR